MTVSSPKHPESSPPRSFAVRVLRQDGPAQKPYWQEFRVEREPDMNVISVLQKIAEEAQTADGRAVPPVAWECNCLEEVCGACTMLVNGRVRQACTALVDRLLAQRPRGIELRPMTKFPVLRDLVVDRSRIFASLEKIRAWLPIESYLDMGPGLRQSQAQQEMAYLYSKCMSCGCCLGPARSSSRSSCRAARGRRPRSSTPGSGRRTGGRSWGPTPSPRSSCSTAIRSAR
jgi:succinate dehydrogenase / fumarate reductase iron-sulfur subunit